MHTTLPQWLQCLGIGLSHLPQSATHTLLSLGTTLSSTQSDPMQLRIFILLDLSWDDVFDNRHQLYSPVVFTSCCILPLVSNSGFQFRVLSCSFGEKLRMESLGLRLTSPHLLASLGCVLCGLIGKSASRLIQLENMHYKSFWYINTWKRLIGWVNYWNCIRLECLSE